MCLKVSGNEQVAESLRAESLRTALVEIVRLAGTELIICDGNLDPADALPRGDLITEAIPRRGAPIGHVTYQEGSNPSSARLAVSIICKLLEFVAERERAVGDLAEALLANFSELSMLYTLLPALSSLEEAREIGGLLVKETARVLNCRRVSLLVLDEKRESLKVLASQGLPEEVNKVSIPLSGSIAGQALRSLDFLVVNNTLDRPDLMALSRGDYDTTAFTIVRVPLEAHGDPIGVLTVTERENGAEFTARDCKLLGGLSAVGSSALMNCRLHAAINRQMLNTIEALALAVDAKDVYTHDHSRRVCTYCTKIAKRLGVDGPAVLRELHLTGLLHDIGKIGISDQILRKKGSLTSEEFAVIQTHSQIGERIVRSVEGLERVAEAILHHHERYDGSGYPSGLSAESIPIMARMVSVADVYDCLTSERPYRRPMTPEEAIAELRRVAGTQFDSVVVGAMVEVVLETTNPPPTESEALPQAE